MYLTREIIANVRQNREIVDFITQFKIGSLLVYFALFDHDNGELGLVVKAHKQNGTHHYSDSVESPLALDLRWHGEPDI